MLRIYFNMVNTDDKITPLTVTQALVDSDVLRVGDLREIRDHLTAYLERKDREALFGSGIPIDPRKTYSGDGKQS